MKKNSINHIIALILCLALVFSYLCSCDIGNNIRDKYAGEMCNQGNKSLFCDNYGVFFASTLKLTGENAPTATIIKSSDGKLYAAYPQFTAASLTDTVKSEIDGFISKVKLPENDQKKLDYTAEVFSNYINFTFALTSSSAKDDRVFMFCLDTSSGTIPSLKALFKYEKFAETLYPYIKSQISGNSAFSGLYDSEKLASFCETKSEIKYFHRTAAGATLFFDDSTFAGEGKTLKLFISNSVLDTAGKPGGTDNYNPVVDNNEKVIALSFDDGPNPLQTPRLLDMIERYGIKVTFFQIGEQIGSKDGKVFPESKKILERQISLGCEIGNHSYTHANFNNITDAEAKKELELTSSLITSACGEYPILFRPPGGNIKNKKSLCTELGYFIINWAVDTEDWKLKKLATEEATAQILQTVKSNAKSGRIILMHDLYKNSVDAAEHVIEYLLSEGYRFVTISELCDLRNKTPDGQVIFNRSSLA